MTATKGDPGLMYWSSGDVEVVKKRSRRGEERYSDDQPRDDHGRFDGGGGDSGTQDSGSGSATQSLPSPSDTVTTPKDVAAGVVGTPGADSKWSASDVNQVHQAVDDMVAAHPEMAPGQPNALQSISFLSQTDPPPGFTADEWARTNGMMQETGALGVTYSEPEWDGSRIVLDDTSRYPFDDPANQAAGQGMTAPASQTPYGTAMHEMGHAWADAHGIITNAGPVILQGVTDSGASQVQAFNAMSGWSQYAMSNGNEGMAEMFATANTPGFSLPGVMGDAWTSISSTVDSSPATPIPSDLAYLRPITFAPDAPIWPEVQEAARTNLAAGDYVAAMPLYDAMRYGDYPVSDGSDERSLRYSDDQPRDDQGRFSGDGGDSSSSDAATAVEAGQHASVSEADAKAAVDAIAASGTPANLENLHIDGVGNGNLYDYSATEMSRADMPQVPSTPADLQAYSDYLAQNGITATQEQVSPTDLHATQDEIDPTKVAGIEQALENNPDALSGKTIVISQDNAIVDGHHSWAAEALYSMSGHADYESNVLRLSTNITTALSVTQSFDAQQGIAHQSIFEPSAPGTLGRSADFGETPEGDPPDTKQPWLWFDGGWLLIATDTDDGVPDSLDHLHEKVLVNTTVDSEE